MRCNSCQKEIAESGVAYGINPDALCKCPRGAGDMNAAAKEIKTLDTLIKALKDAAAIPSNIFLRAQELEEQRAAALKLADLWEAQAIKYPLENATSLVSPYTAEAVAVAQAAVKACAKELRAIYADKEQA